MVNYPRDPFFAIWVYRTRVYKIYR
eukprot:SAG22_NODE_19190_length_277_cov_0.853933_1_plen_24_part_10